MESHLKSRSSTANSPKTCDILFKTPMAASCCLSAADNVELLSTGCSFVGLEMWNALLKQTHPLNLTCEVNVLFMLWPPLCIRLARLDCCLALNSDFRDWLLGRRLSFGQQGNEIHKLSYYFHHTSLSGGLCLDTIEPYQVFSISSVLYLHFILNFHVTQHFHCSLLFSVHALYLEGYLCTLSPLYLKNLPSTALACLFVYIYTVSDESNCSHSSHCMTGMNIRQNAVCLDTLIFVK